MMKMPLALVETIILMANKLNMGIVAEGVEDENNWKF